MALTPMDIHNKEFSKGFRGYNEDEVDQFLDEIVAEFERLYKDNIELKDKISNLNEMIDQYKSIEDTLKETLVTAQKTADEVAASAQKKSELIIKEAEDLARKIIENANNEVISIQNEYLNQKKQIQIFRTRFKTLLEANLEILNNDKDLFGDESSG